MRPSQWRRASWFSAMKNRLHCPSQSRWCRISRAVTRPRPRGFAQRNRWRCRCRATARGRQFGGRVEQPGRRSAPTPGHADAVGLGGAAARRDRCAGRWSARRGRGHAAASGGSRSHAADRAERTAAQGSLQVSMRSTGGLERLARVRFLTLPSSRSGFQQQEVG